MLKKIRVDELRLGMYLHQLAGRWVDHPFWTTKFVLSDPADLAKLVQSSVAECWIDVAKGLDVAGAVAVAVVTATGSGGASASTDAMDSGAVTAALDSPVASSPGLDRARPLEAELGQAAALLTRSRRIVMTLFQEARMGRAMDAEHCLPLVAEIADSMSRNAGALVSLARLKTHDDYSYLHSIAVCALMVSLARQLGGDEAAAREAGVAGLMHDIGKAAMPLEVLNKPGRLTAAEYEIIKQHPERGRDLLSGAAVPAAALDVCLHHHERPDGKGYPRGLAGTALSTLARMGAVCDVYDAITSNRPYKLGWDPAESIAQMADWTRAGQFDAAIFQAFVKALGVYPVGSLVRMKSGRLAVVVEQNAQQLLKPRVKVFFSTRSQMSVPLEVLDTASPSCSDRIVARESNAVWKFGHLDEIWAGREVRGQAARAA